MGQINIIVDDQTKLKIKKLAALNGMAVDKYCLYAALNFNSETSGMTKGLQVGVITAKDKMTNEIPADILKNNGQSSGVAIPKYGIPVREKKQKSDK